MNKTIQDTVLTVKQYQSARVQFDAYRNENEQQALQSPTMGCTPNGAGVSSPATGTIPNSASDNNLEQHKSRFELLHRDVDVKLKLLDENKVRNVQLFLLLSCRGISLEVS